MIMLTILFVLFSIFSFTLGFFLGKWIVKQPDVVDESQAEEKVEKKSKNKKS